MSTTHTPPVRLHRPHVNVWLVVAIGLGAALVGLGAWVVVDRTSGGDTATQNATALIDDVNTAFMTGDASAIPSYYASTAVMRSFGTNETYVGVAAISELADGSFTVERISPVTVNGEYATTFVKLTSGGQNVTTISVFQIQDGKVVRQWNFAPGQTPPFDNAVM